MESDMTQRIRYDLKLLLLIILIVPLGFACKFYTGPGSLWVQNSLGGVFYEIFWCLIAALFLINKSSPVRIAVWVFVITSILEVMQLWHPSFLEWIRDTFIGRTLIGTSFVWSDFLYYIIGCIIGGLLMHRIQKA